MNVRRKINKNHPDYTEYIGKCRVLSDAFFKAKEVIEKATLEKYPNWHRQSLDHPAAREIRELNKRFNADLRKLQKEYDYLFSDVEE